MRVRVPIAIVESTQAFLREQGEIPPDGHEGVVLWVGDPATGGIEYEIVPEQETDLLYFEVSLKERHRIARSLAGTGRVVLVQVHSHPEEAWHSHRDDARALPRRVGSLSLVVPDQGRRRQLLEGSALYRLDADGAWLPETLEAIAIDG